MKVEDEKDDEKKVEASENYMDPMPTIIWNLCQCWYRCRPDFIFSPGMCLNTFSFLDICCSWLFGPTLIGLIICRWWSWLFAPQVMELHRPLNCQSCWFPCCLQVFILTDILPPMAEPIFHWSPQNMGGCTFSDFFCPQYMGCILVPMAHLQELEVVIEDIHAGKVFILTL